MSTITIKMVRTLCRETWGSDWWKVGGDEKRKRKAIARLQLIQVASLGLREPIHRYSYDLISNSVVQIEDEPILQIEDEEQMCPICIEGLGNTSTTTTTCNHTFHSTCYTNFICSEMRSRAYGDIVCPMCRTTLHTIE